jgi:hypothetical protein
MGFTTPSLAAVDPVDPPIQVETATWSKGDVKPVWAPPGSHRAPPSSAKSQCGGPPTASIPKTRDQPEEAVGTLLTGVDPIQVTDISVVFSAVALPLTYLPILIIANDPQYMGEHVNGRTLNGAATVYLVIILAAAIAAIPLLVITGAGQ